MPIHYDTIEDGQNKKSRLLLSFLVRIVLFFAFFRRDFLCVKSIISVFHWLHLDNYTPFENKCFNPRNQIHRVAFVKRVNSICVQVRHAIRGVHARQIRNYTGDLHIRWSTSCPPVDHRMSHPHASGNVPEVVHRMCRIRWTTGCAASGGPLDVCMRWTTGCEH